MIARNTALTFKGKPIDAKAIGKDLGVRYVLEGSVQPSGDQMRVNAQLIDAESGAHVWAEQFDTSRADLLQMQDEIVAHLAHAMEFNFTRPRPPASNGRPRRIPTPRIWLSNARGDWKADFRQGSGRGLLVSANRRSLDPNNVRALSVLSVKFLLPVAFGRSADPKADLKRADELVSQALALDPNCACAHVKKALIL